MEDYTQKAPIPWPMLIITFLLCTILLVSLCLAILDPAEMQWIRTPCSELQHISLCSSAEVLQKIL